MKIPKLAMLFCSAFILLIAIKNTSGAVFEDTETASDVEFVPTYKNINYLDFEMLTKYVYTVDETAYVYPSDIVPSELLRIPMITDFSGTAPKILIFHTHSQENFIDSEKGKVDDTIVGVGAYLADILVKEYNVAVVHDRGRYDVKNGVEYREGSYERMEPAITKLLKKYPSIEVAIDLHRDGVLDERRFETVIDGKSVAKLMFFNGITRLNVDGSPYDVDFENPYLKENLAFSLNMHLTTNEFYPTLTRPIYIKPYRYSLHMVPKSLLVEVGANTSTVSEAKSAMPYLARVLMEVLRD